MIIPFTELHPFIPVLVWKSFFHLNFEICTQFCLWWSLVILWGWQVINIQLLSWPYQDHRASERSNFTLHFGVGVCSYYIPPVTKLGGVVESPCLSCRSFHGSRLCPEDTFWTVQPFVTKLGMVVHHCEVKILGCCLQGKATVRAYIIKSLLFLV